MAALKGVRFDIVNRGPAIRCDAELKSEFF